VPVAVGAAIVVVGVGASPLGGRGVGCAHGPAALTAASYPARKFPEPTSGAGGDAVALYRRPRRLYLYSARYGWTEAPPWVARVEQYEEEEVA
jgi:hypothetical protein